MSITFEFADANSKQAETWAQTMEPLIDSVLEQKRKEVLDFYS